MTNYDVFAKYYDSVMGGRIDEATKIEGLIKKYNPETKNILELACGTGIFLKYFFNHGYNVAGIDLSEEMLEKARQKLPSVSLLQQDMSAFSLPEKYDVVLCLFDSINHLLNYDDWEKVFSNVYKCLNDKGVFIFDINTIKKLNDLIVSKSVTNKFDGGEINMEVSLKDGVCNWKIEITEKDPSGNEVTQTENIQEQTFPTERIEQSLKNIFSEVLLFDSNNNKASEDAKRVYFVCVK